MDGMGRGPHIARWRAGSHRLGRHALPAALALALSVIGGAQALAQVVNCRALQAQIAAMGARPDARAARYQQAASRQGAELARTVAYAQSLGCNRQSFLFFGDPPPPQCAALNARIAAQRANLAQLQTQARASGGGDQRRMLQAQYQAYCGAEADAGRRGFFNRLFDDDAPPSRRDPLDEIDPPGGIFDIEPQRERPTMAVCVRTCDGGFFPVSYSATRASFADLGELCRALCPNAQTALYTMKPGEEIDAAESIDGEPYSSLSNAGKFKKKFDPACACKPPGKSWAQVLAEAERLLDNKGRRDLIVTPEKAEELSRPRPIAARGGKKQPPAPRQAKADPKAPPAKVDPDADIEKLERAGKIEADEANRSNSGIAPGQAGGGGRYSLVDGRPAEVIGADGVKRRIRVIGPQL